MPAITTAKFDDVKFGSQQIGSVYYGDTTLWSPIPQFQRIWVIKNPGGSQLFLRGEWFVPPAKYPNMIWPNALVGDGGVTSDFEYRRTVGVGDWLHDDSQLMNACNFISSLGEWDLGILKNGFWDQVSPIEIRYRRLVKNRGGSERGWTDWAYYSVTLRDLKELRDGNKRDN